MVKRISKLAKKVILALFSAIGLTAISGCTSIGPDMYGMPENLENSTDDEEQEINQDNEEADSDDTEIPKNIKNVCMYGMPEFLFQEIDESEELKNPIKPEDFEE